MVAEDSSPVALPSRSATMASAWARITTLVVMYPGELTSQTH
jgi:hypothetical protein